MDMENNIKILLDAHSINEGFARMAAAAFSAQLDPTLEELADIKTAISEAVTNAIIHGYEGKPGTVTLSMRANNRLLTFIVTDEGRGIADIAKAMQPMFTSKPDLDRSGMGFTVMESFMDSLTVNSTPGHGTTVMMTKTIHG
ncbi:MAG: anti-sigma F factor [Clostridia bacterium]|nr:anti-sigma F factor [Clostridia bacterium]